MISWYHLSKKLELFVVLGAPLKPNIITVYSSQFGKLTAVYLA
jgi:hypothetical protein